MNLYCKFDNSCLEENTKSGKLIFVCGVCGYSRAAEPEETLLATVNVGRKEVTVTTDSLSNRINQRIKIDCECGGKIGIIVKTPAVIKVCTFCQKQQL